MPPRDHEETDKSTVQPGLERRCPFCEKQQKTDVEGCGEWSKVYCARCGLFEIETALARYLQCTADGDEDHRLKRYLGCHTRQEEKDGRRPRLPEAGWRDLARKHLQTSFNQKKDLLQGLCFKRAGAYRRWFSVNPNVDALLIDDPWGDDFEQIVDELVHDGVIEFVEYVDDASPPLYRLGPNGRRELDALEPPQHAGSLPSAETQEHKSPENDGRKRAPKRGRKNKYTCEQRLRLHELVAKYPNLRIDLEKFCHDCDAGAIPPLDQFSPGPKEGKDRVQSARSWIEDFRTKGRIDNMIKSIKRLTKD